MTSRIVVNNIQSDSGINTVTFNSEVSSTKFVAGSTGITTTQITVGDTVINSNSIGIGSTSTTGPVCKANEFVLCFGLRILLTWSMLLFLPSLKS